MTKDTKDMKYSPAIDFLSMQHRHRAAVREAFKKEAGDFLLAHELVLSGITSCLARFGGKKWSADLDEAIRLKVEQTAQLSALFLQGIDPCEVAISEGLYGQAATLIRQQMEILGAIDEVWIDKRNPRSTPKVSSLRKDIRQHYGGLSELAHAAVPDYLKNMHTDIKGDLVGAGIVPTFNKELALFLYRIELGLLFLFAERQEDALKAAYEEEIFIASELKLLGAAMSAANKAAEEIGDLPNADPA
ncbi:hypothetical protein [Sulfitobacter faviae]|uniref:hypothetical protein n=1 Tax=Sulfitobacter faviae TaxID=1775881 RepID=UPI00398CB096